MQGPIGPSRQLYRLVLGAPQELPLLTSMSRAAACDAWSPRSPTSPALIGSGEPTWEQRIGWFLPETYRNRNEGVR